MRRMRIDLDRLAAGQPARGLVSGLQRCAIEHGDDHMIVDAHSSAYRALVRRYRSLAGVGITESAKAAPAGKATAAGVPGKVVQRGPDSGDGRARSRPAADARPCGCGAKAKAAGRVVEGGVTSSVLPVIKRTPRAKGTGSPVVVPQDRPSLPPARMRLAPTGDSKDKRDDQQARWGRKRHEGFGVGRYLQPPPTLFTSDHHPAWLGDLYRGRSAFLICGGPSFGQLDHAKLRQPGVLTMGINNSVKTFRPNLWISVDNPSHFIRSIWLDPAIIKFVPICHAGDRIFDSDQWEWTGLTVRDCPAMFYYKRNEHFRAEQFLWEDTCNWGNHKRYGGGRSVMLPAVRLLFYLGVRRVFLLGADFNMDEKTKYHFDQDRAPGSIRGNNSTYQKLNQWFAQLRPLFEAEGYHIYNCNPQSKLTAFGHVSYEDAMASVFDEWGRIDVSKERTAGLYDREKPKT